MRSLLAFLLLTGAAFADDTKCTSHDELTAGLLRNFGETVSAHGDTREAWAMELFTNIKTGTWTILMVSPDKKIGCLAASGDGIKLQPPGDPA